MSTHEHAYASLYAALIGRANGTLSSEEFIRKLKEVKEELTTVAERLS